MNPVVNQPHQAAHNNNVPFYLSQNFINGLRVTAVALIALAPIASAVAGALAPPAAAVVAPLFIGGSVLFGATLIIQAVFKTPGCEEARTSRGIAGVCIVALPIIGWIPAAFLWHHSYMANKQ